MRGNILQGGIYYQGEYNTRETIRLGKIYYSVVEVRTDLVVGIASYKYAFLVKVVFHFLSKR